MIYKLISMTKPAGTTIRVAIRLKNNRNDPAPRELSGLLPQRWMGSGRQHLLPQCWGRRLFDWAHSSDRNGSVACPPPSQATVACV